MGGRRPRYRGKRKKSKKETRDETTGEITLPKQEISEIQDINLRCSKPHRLVVTDKETKIKFLIATDAQVSLYPKFLISEDSDDINRIEHSEVLIDSSGTIIYTFGRITLKIDLGLGEIFSWKFTLVDFERPIIGRDFLSHFNLQINFQKMCLMNFKIKLETSRISTVPCECHRHDISDDGWPNITAIFKRPIKHRYHITDKNTKKSFLVGCTSQISVFPKSEVKEEDLEPFNGSFELHGVYGKVAQVLGWLTQKLDFGLGREFTWKFAVIDIDKPIIGLDFIQHFDLTQQLKMGYFRLFDSKTKMTTPAPSGPCDCGHFREGWPKSHFLITMCLIKNIDDSEDDSGFVGSRHDSMESLKLRKENKSLESSNDSIKESNLNSKAFNLTPKPFSQNRSGLELSKESSTALKLSSESPKGVNRKSTEFDQYPQPFTQNPKTFNQIFREFTLLNKNSQSCKENPKPSNQNSKESNQYPQPFSQNLKPFNQSSKGLQLSKKIPEPFKQNPELSNKNCKESTEKSPELSNKNARESGQDRLQKTFSNSSSLEMLKEKPEEETLESKKKSPKDNNTNSLQLDNKSDLKENSKDAREEFESVKKKSTSPKNGNPQVKVKETSEIKSINLKENSEPIKDLQPKLREQSYAKSSNQVDTYTVKHRFHVLDIKTKMLFLIGTESELSVFPQHEVKEEELEPFDGSFELSGAFGKKEKVFGWTTRVIDIEVGREFTWKFAVINICKPVLGWDFISHFGFAFHTGGLLDSETKITAPPPTGPCDCGQINDGWPTFVNFMKNTFAENSKQESESPKKESEYLENAFKDLEKESKGSTEESRGTPKESKSKKKSAKKDDSSLILTKNESSKLKQEKPKKEIKSPKEDPKPKAKEKESAKTSKESLKSKQENSREETKSPKEDLKFKESKVKEQELGGRSDIAKVDYKSGMKHRFHITDKISNLSFLLDIESEISVFPKSKMGYETLQKLEASYEIIDSKGTVMPVHGWTTRKLDFGIGKEFFWWFAVIETEQPILSLNFPKKFDLGINKKKQIIYNKYGRCTPFPSEPCDCGELNSTVLSSLKIRRVQSEINHRFHVLDKNSKTLFFVSEVAQVSIFPRSQVQGRSMEASKNLEIIDCVRIVLPIYGWITIKVDFGLEKQFQWKFAVVDTLIPIIGVDFLNNFRLKSDYTMEFPQLVDPETQLETSEFTGSCNCGDTYVYPGLMVLRKLDSVSKEFPIQEKLENNITRCSDVRCPQEERMIFIERDTGMPYLLSGAAVSVFPESEVKEEEIVPFDDSFYLVQLNGSVIPVHGWTTRKLDFGLGRYFFWKFALINIGRPMLANDFLHHYNFIVSYKGKSISDDVTSKTVVSSTEFCECQARHFWPDISTMGIKFRSKIKTSPRTRKIEDITSLEIDDNLGKETFTSGVAETSEDG